MDDGRRAGPTGADRVGSGSGEQRAALRRFCYTVFQFGKGALARNVVAQAFGGRALVYLDEAWRATDQPRRIELCREARHDPEVVRAHYANRLALGGRHSTRFRSAFLVRAPVTAALVTAIHRPENGRPAPAADAELGDVVGRPRRAGRRQVRGRDSNVNKDMELTRFRGHPQTWGGGHDAEEPTAVFAGVPAADSSKSASSSSSSSGGSIPVSTVSALP